MVACNVGIVIVEIAPFGQPAASAASLIIFTVSKIQLFAPGCGENTILFPALMEMIALYITVDVGFVEGIIPATTPTGTPTSIILFSLSSFKIPIVF